MRLNRFLAQATGMSRRAADELISTGNVMLNHRAGMLGDQVTEHDTVTIEGTPIDLPEGYIYLVLNKPAGYVCSRLQQGKSPTIYDLLPGEYHRLKPVGRLDKDSSGVLLLTDDGDLAFSMAHPSFVKTKQYEVTLNRPLTKSELHQLREGVLLEDGPSRFDTITGSGSNWSVTLHEGRNRQIRRTFAALGLAVTKLHRRTFGPLGLDELKPGEYQSITKADLS